MAQNICALLVDDKAFARNVGRRVLTAAGVGEIFEASNGFEAYKFLRDAEQIVDVVFSDLMMPDMDGIQFFRHLATLPAVPALAIVSSGDSALLTTAETAARARKISVLGSFRKPFTQDAAVQALAQLGTMPVLRTSGPTTVHDVGPDDIETALAEDQFLLHFQPKVSCPDGRVDGFEALARWRHPERGVIPPVIFIRSAEEHGKIDALTRRTIALALRQCADWSKGGLHTKVSVNLSAYMLTDVEFPDLLAEDVARHGLEPAQLILELTESGVFQNAANTLEILARLHMKGFALSIDDFGTGYSTIEQLSRVPFSEIKIDRAFIHGAHNNERTRAILESSVELARRLNLKVVAEGAESQHDWDLLSQIGVDLVQGYFVSKPMVAEHVQGWMSGRVATNRGSGASEEA